MNHGDEITLLIGKNEPNWRASPSPILLELCIPSAMLLIMCIKGYPRAPEEIKFAHSLNVKGIKEQVLLTLPAGN